MASKLHPTLQNSLCLSIIGSALLLRVYTVSVGLAAVPSFGFFFTTWFVFRCFVRPYFLSPLRDIPTIFGLPVLGNIIEIFSNEVGVPQREWHKRHGPIIRYIYCFGSERLSVIDDEAVKHITVKDSYNFVKPQSVQNWMSSVLGRGVLLVDGDEHVRQRKALAPAFSTASIRDLTPVFWEKGVVLTNMLLDRVEASSVTVEIGDWLNRATLDVIGAAAFGYEINSLETPVSPLRDAYSSVFAFDLVSQVIQLLNNLCSWSRYIPSKMNRDMDSAIRTIKDTAAVIVRAKEHQIHDDAARDIMALVTKQNNSKRGEKNDDEILSFETMRDQVMTFLGAGHDTTATGVLWTLDLLAKNPSIQEKLRQEVRAAFPYLHANAATEEKSRRDDRCDLRAVLDTAVDVDQLPYLSNVCRESLRYIPPIPLTIRESLAPAMLCGYSIPAGTWIYVIANVMNRAPMYWGGGEGEHTSDPNQFDPDRWDRLPDGFTTNSFMTFLHGPRSCIGRKFAETEMKVFLCCLLARFKFEVDPDWPDQERHKMWRLVLKPRDGMHLRMSRV